MSNLQNLHKENQTYFNFNKEILLIRTKCFELITYAYPVYQKMPNNNTAIKYKIVGHIDKLFEHINRIVIQPTITNFEELLISLWSLQHKNQFLSQPVNEKWVLAVRPMVAMETKLMEIINLIQSFIPYLTIK